jgi:hypothetical protein
VKSGMRLVADISVASFAQPKKEKYRQKKAIKVDLYKMGFNI